MRLLTWLVLIALSVASVLTGQLKVALIIAAAKALLVGLEFMELRHAARPHAAAYVLFIGGVLLVLVVLTS